MRLKLIFAVLLLSSAMPALAQVVAQGSSRSTPYYVGGGYSRFSPDWGPGRTKDGLNVYAGMTLYNLPAHLAGLGIEGEWRDIFFNPRMSNPSATPGNNINNLSQTTIGGGINFKLLHWFRYRPYAKYLLEYGKVSYGNGAQPPLIPKTDVVTSMVQVMGGGVEVLTVKHVWFRADYSYETWPNLFGLQKNLNPVGVTLGVTYDFHR
jgi:opacity protein-like surface antigen